MSEAHARWSTSTQRLEFKPLVDKASSYVTTIKPRGNWEFCIDDTLQLEWSANRSKVESLAATVVEVDDHLVVCYVVVKRGEHMPLDWCTCRKIPHPTTRTTPSMYLRWAAGYLPCRAQGLGALTSYSSDPPVCVVSSVYVFIFTCLI